MSLQDWSNAGEIFGVVFGSWLWVWLASLAARPGQTGRTLTTAMVAAAILALLGFASYQAGTPGERVLAHMGVMTPCCLFWLWLAHRRFKREAATSGDDQPAARASSSTMRKARASSKASRLT